MRNSQLPRSFIFYYHLLVENNNNNIKGCGNSKLSEDMYRDGFRCITNIDYSEVVIENMRDRSPEARSMQWIVMDMTDLKFPNGAFDFWSTSRIHGNYLLKAEFSWSASSLK